MEKPKLREEPMKAEEVELDPELEIRAKIEAKEELERVYGKDATEEQIEEKTQEKIDKLRKELASAYGFGTTADIESTEKRSGLLHDYDKDQK